MGLPVRTRLLTSSCWRCGARLNGAQHGLFHLFHTISAARGKSHRPVCNCRNYRNCHNYRNCGMRNCGMRNCGMRDYGIRTAVCVAAMRDDPA
ncbi:hypothetical protein KL86DES1_10550 [uncultured Desulfovibrio sp.]|uniref:Uncharacterized protein n=1 Tax=uncultured Desulfovibrio sp. TaxID=167968 RepID=A0A212KZV4_9BACT|nr:hypothetical protein KL86DES1_10550 [uncultured Desulfovibrio sp.]VZH32425.1 conserved protein of unknown function [Desulfovibrio sp. 86]